MFPKHAGAFAAGIVVANPGRFSPRLVRFAKRIAAPVFKAAHRPALTGFANLPASGPFLLVANHSAGLGIAEIFSFYVLYFERFGDRPLAGFALPLDWRVPGMKRIVEAAGAIPSTYAHAEETLRKGVPILMFPGGDYETTRPIWQANKVDFGGRQGFLKIARDAGVPIVPMGIRGSHFTAPMLLRSNLFATLLVAPRLIGQKRWGISLLGALGAAALLTFAPVALPWRALLAWLWLGSPLSYLPWIPWKIRFQIGKPISPAELFVDGQTLDDALTRVQAEIQTLVD